MAKKIIKANIVLTVEELDELDDLLDLYLNDGADVKRLNRGVLLQIQEQVGEIMGLVYDRMEFTTQRVKSNKPKYLM
jgi:hypothetical protein